MTKFPLIADESVGILHTGDKGDIQQTDQYDSESDQDGKERGDAECKKNPVISAKSVAMNGRIAIPRQLVVEKSPITSP